VDAISSGLLSPTVRAKLEAAEAEKAALVPAPVRIRAKSAGITTLVTRLADAYQRMVENLVGNLQRDVPRARLDLQGIVGRMTLKPHRSERFLVG
jgi:hypothetical protein